MRLVLFTLFTMFIGCTSNQGPDVIFLDSSQYTAVFDAAVVAANNDGMKPLLLDRRSGVISTEPVVAGSFVEPWKPKPSTPRQGLENTLSLQRRVARFEFTPTTIQTIQGLEEGELRGPDLLTIVGEDLTQYKGPLELRVWIYVDRKYTQGIQRGTWTLQSESIMQVIPTQEPWEQVPGAFWTPINRDVARERSLLATIDHAIAK